MRILLVSHGLPPESVGGVEQHVAGLARELAARGQRVHVYTRTGRSGAPGQLVRERTDAGPVTRVIYRYEDVRCLEDLHGTPVLDEAFARFLESETFDVAHVHHLTGISSAVLRRLSEAGVPTALTLHDYWTICPRGQMWHREERMCPAVDPAACSACLEETFAGWLAGGTTPEAVAAHHRHALEILNAADALVVPSARAIPPFAALGVAAERFEVVENAVDTGALGRLAPPAGRAGAPLRVGYLGTLIPSKGLHVAVEALDLLPRNSALLQIWGNTVPYHGDRSYLMRVFSGLRPDAAVSYHGPYSQARLPSILAGLDVVVVPALWAEAFGLTAREALAAARPVVVSRIGGLQDAVENGVEGFCVPPGDPAALAEALGRLATDRDLLARMAAAARRRVRGFPAMAEDLLGIYRRLARA